MVKRDTSVTDFAVAPRKPRQEPQVGQSVPSKSAPATPEVVVTDKAANMQPTDIDASATNPQADFGPNQQSGNLISANEDVRRERTTTRALRQEASRLRLQDLKQTKARESKHFVNCPLDFDTKQRLARAAVENEIKMTVIIKTAIDQYLRDNGY
ncbi:hypothetical protein [Agrobacterium sp. ICMP 6402]|uniref:hypothetical protein n=1 Tax=Rhizobium/Agrobacterium group TaxID=227290 RepID=UPI001296B1C6|nr:hypothetical protein [Agrobacterium sp. ICMP 6402]MQB13200.1 hypothetical protein [Agrobacterium sp. ICMP 6402]